MDLFAPSASLTALPIDDGRLDWLAQLPLALPTAQVFEQLLAQTDWRAESITLWGKRMLQPRLCAWHGDADASYAYSGLTLTPLPFTPLLQMIKQAVEQASGHRFNSVLLNYYRDGRDSMGMHSDDEPELGPEPVIASLSLGACRSFILKHRRSKRTVKLELGDGSLLLMSGATQTHWLHGIHKTARPCGPRLNLTFRKIVK